jgi:hypothetical protein
VAALLYSLIESARGGWPRSLGKGSGKRSRAVQIDSSFQRARESARNQFMLVFVKVIYTLVWGVMAASTFYAIYAGLVWRFNTPFCVSIGLIVVELTILVLTRRRCPLTTVAERYTSDRRDNFDIYLPEWVARHNKTIFSVIFALGALAVALNRIERLV